MSNFTNTYNELLYAFYGNATQLNTFTTEANLMGTYPVCALPNLRILLNNTGVRSSSLRIRARGRVGSTGTPTFTFTLRLLTSETWSAGGLVLGTSGAITAASGVTLAPWQMDADMGLFTLPAAAATATVKTMATIDGAAFTNDGSIPANNATPNLTTLDLSAQYYLFLSVACSASSASNICELHAFKLYGEN